MGQDCPAFAESYYALTACCSSAAPKITLSDDDDAAIYFSSGTTGFPKAILHSHRALMISCEVEMNHHKQTREDNFLCIPPLYHTGAKMHWFGSFLSGSKAVLLRGVKPEWILRAVSEEQITIVWLLVPWAQDILDAIERGDIKLEELQTRSVEADAYRRPAGSAQPDQTLEKIFSRTMSTTPITACRNLSVPAVSISASKTSIKSALSARPATVGKCRLWMKTATR